MRQLLVVSATCQSLHPFCWCCRSRTLLHFVAREVARQHPDGASLAAELPSMAAAAQLDLGAAAAELEGLAVEAREVQAALAAGGSSCTAPQTAFHASVTERLAALQAQLDEAQSAFKCVWGWVGRWAIERRCGLQR